VLSLKKQYVDHGMYNWLHASGMDMTDTLNLSLSKYAIDGPYSTEHRTDNRIGIDIPYVRNPEFLDVKLSTKELVSRFLVPAVDFMYANAADEWNGNTGFMTHEALKLKRILVDVLCTCKDADSSVDSTSSDPKIAHGRSTFYQFVNKYDIRRGKTFLETFPELTEFYNVCKLEFEKLVQ
jgi:hypothetical protein